MGNHLHKRRQRQPGKVQKDKAGHVAAGDLDSQELKSPDEAKQGEKKVHFVGDAAPTQVHVDLAGKGAGQHKETENVKDKGNSRTNGTSTSTSVRGGALKKGSTNLVVAEIEGQKPRRLKDSYKLGSKLGEGSYGKVRRGVSLKTGEEVAVKSILKKNIRRIETLKREIKIMLQLDHRNIVKLHDVFEDNTHLHIVMELCTGGELFDSIVEQGSYSESDAAELLQQILGAVAYLHGNHVAHRDLKPENFLFSSKDKDATLKIIDFGLSRFYKDKAYMKTRVGTPYYIAPEVLKKQYDQACDLWSVGVIMYILLCGYPPFWGNTEKDIFQRIKLGKFDYPKEEWSKISDSAKQLIERLLDVNPATRITAVEALEHPWLESKRGEKLHPGMMKKLTKFAKLNRLKRAALGVIARMLNEKEISNLRKQFRAIDADGNGYITVTELTQALRSVGLDPSAQEVDSLIRTIDADGNGVIDYTEFIAASMEAHLYLRDEILQKAFSYFDLDKTGKISADNLKKGLGEEDEVLLDNILSSVDDDANGFIDFEEFKTMMKSG